MKMILDKFPPGGVKTGRISIIKCVISLIKRLFWALWEQLYNSFYKIGNFSSGGCFARRTVSVFWNTVLFFRCAGGWQYRFSWFLANPTLDLMVLCLLSKNYFLDRDFFQIVFSVEKATFGFWEKRFKIC